MKTRITVSLFMIIGCVFACQNLGKNAHFSVKSPNTENEIRINSDNGILHYAVSHSGKEVIKSSKLGFVFAGQDSLYHNLFIEDIERHMIDEEWEPVWGEYAKIKNHAHLMKVHVKENQEPFRKFTVEMMAYNDGVAFRYVYPKHQTEDSLFIMDEITEFNVAIEGNAWWIPAYRKDRYEYLYQSSPINKIDTVHTPLTIELNNDVALSIHEADLKDFASFTVMHKEGTKLKTDLVPWADGVKVKTDGSFKTPWRCIIIGDDVTDLAESTMVLNLNEPNTIEDTSWIKPYKYLGIWWGMHIGKYTFWEGEKQGATTKNAKMYIDYAEDLGIDHLLIEGWNKGWTDGWYLDALHHFDFVKEADNFDLNTVTDYAKEHGVQIVGYHETGSNIDNYKSQIDAAFKKYNELGIHTVKIGQVGSKLQMKEWHHGQYGVEYYRYVLKKAAEYKLTIFYHEPIKDTGERRTYPNMLSREGARGQEYNAWSEGNPPSHSCILPFTRMLSGPFDFTPGIFDVEIEQGYPGRRVHTTRAKQLALYVVIYSPVQMLADLPEYYVDQPEFQFLKDVPVDWADSKVLAGKTGEYVVTARKDKHTDKWYLGAITNEKSRTLHIDLSFLDQNLGYNATIYTDAEGSDLTHNPDKVQIITKEVHPNEMLELNLAAGGGCAIEFEVLTQ